MQTGRELAIDANYVSKLERGVITWPNRAYRDAFRTFFGAASDAELGFYPSRTGRDAERWKTLPVRQGDGGVSLVLPGSGGTHQRQGMQPVCLAGFIPELATIPIDNRARRSRRPTLRPGNGI